MKFNVIKYVKATYNELISLGIYKFNFSSFIFLSNIVVPVKCTSGISCISASFLAFLWTKKKLFKEINGIQTLGFLLNRGITTVVKSTKY